MATYWAECLADTPTLLFKMDEASGNLADSSGSGYVGTANGSITYQASGPDATGIPYGVTYGSGGYFSVTDSGAGMDLGDGPFTIELWFKRNDLTTTRYLLGKADNATAPGYEIEVRNSGTIDTVRLGDGAGSTHVDTGGVVSYIDDTNWHHLAFTRALATNAKIYIDGSATSVSASAKTFSDNNLALILGRMTASVGAFDGSMAGVALYKSELSGARVSAHYAARSTGASASFTAHAAPAQAFASAPGKS